MGMDFKKHEFDFDGNKMKAMIWDTAGQEKFRSMAKGNLKKA